MCLRFVSFIRNEDPPVERGVFQSLYDLERSGELSDDEIRLFHEAERWFDENLARGSILPVRPQGTTARGYQLVQGDRA
jgi:hypothetical protein